jgi:hypothetical protein
LRFGLAISHIIRTAMNQAATQQVHSATFTGLRRAAVAMLLVGLAQTIPLVIALAAGERISVALRAEWLVTVAVAGAVYILCAGPVWFAWAGFIWVARVVAGAQVFIFAALAALAIVAALRQRDPGAMTQGVLLFGSAAAVHLFILRGLWLTGATRHIAPGLPGEDSSSGDRSFSPGKPGAMCSAGSSPGKPAGMSRRKSK